MRLMLLLSALFCLMLSQSVFAKHPLPMRERAALMDDILKERLTTLLPTLMREQGIDTWLLIAREYNEDPIVKTMLPSTWLNARRRTILVIHTPKVGSPSFYAIARYKVGELFEKAWDKEQEPSQWQALKKVLTQLGSQRIGVNTSSMVALADGMTATEYQALENTLKNAQFELVSAQTLAVRWLETRTPKELAVYPEIVAMGHAIIKEAFSNKVITPNVTTTDDVVWWLREKSRELKLINWFHPTVSIQRASPEKFDHLTAFSARPDAQVIQPGDLLHVDFGITYLRLNTDQQQHAYVLRAGEQDAPEYLKKALKRANQVQDVFTGYFKAGRTGNEVLKLALTDASEKGLRPHIYTHPIGYHGHAAGTTLGMWDAQNGVPGTGDHPLYLNTAYSIELNGATYLDEWGKDIRIMLEENALFDKNGVTYLDGRQTKFHLIQSQ